MKFEPTKESVSTHEVPAWYEDAKFGIFIHWGLYSVPAWAPKTSKNIIEMMQEGGFNSTMPANPYAEWYLNSLRIEGSPVAQHHARTYGTAYSYFDFREKFEALSKSMNPTEWAKFFSDAGAKYVVMVTKHHDGYTLWPSRIKNPKMDRHFSRRDFVGEVTKAVRGKGMKMGLYYSGLLDWTVMTRPIRNIFDMINNGKMGKEYTTYATSQWMELIERYKPSILWNDIGYPADYDLNKLFAHYYNEVGDGVVNDRWTQTKISGGPIGRAFVYLVVRMLYAKMKKSGELTMEVKGHHDFTTPEYSVYKEARKKKWESTRGVGKSFAYNQVEVEADMLTGREIIHMLSDIVSKNGNLLLNVGPMPDGTIPEMQKRPLLEVGDWLKANGEAIYGTRPWTRAEGLTEDGKPVRFTQKDNVLYAIVNDGALTKTLTIKDLKVDGNASIKLLRGKNATVRPTGDKKAANGDAEALSWHMAGGDLVVDLPEDLPQQHAYAFALSPLGATL